MLISTNASCLPVTSFAVSLLAGGTIHETGSQSHVGVKETINAYMYTIQNDGLEFKLELLPTLEWEPLSPSSSLLLEELEWITSSTMMCEWILLLASMRIIWIIAIVISLPQCCVVSHFSLLQYKKTYLDQSELRMLH
jgi:hypothetical protein